MSKHKVLSRDEKRDRLLKVFREGQEFYQLKELEKLAKEKGLNQKQVKDILQALVDDGLVDSDKIGPSLFYWRFPNKDLKTKQKQLSELKDTNRMLSDKLVTLEAALKSEQETQNDSDELKRDQLSNAVVSLKEQEKDLSEFIRQNEAIDPEKAAKLNSDAKELFDAGNRWTDNVFAVRSWCEKKFNIEQSALNKQFRLPKISITSTREICSPFN